MVIIRSISFLLFIHFCSTAAASSVLLSELNEIGSIVNSADKTNNNCWEVDKQFMNVGGQAVASADKVDLKRDIQLHPKDEGSIKESALINDTFKLDAVKLSKEEHLKSSEEIETPKIIEEKGFVASNKSVNRGRRNTNHEVPIVKDPMWGQNLKILQDLKQNINIPASSSPSSKSSNTFETNMNVTPQSFTANPFRSFERPAVKASPRPHLDVYELRQIFLNKFIDFEIRAEVLPLPATQSGTPPQTGLRKVVSRANILDFFKELVLPYSVDFSELKVKLDGEFEAELNAKTEANKRSSSKIWTEKSWTDLCRSDNRGFAQGIINELHRLAPNTMERMPFLAPKDKSEADILERWLVTGLIALYPTLDGIIPPKLTKEDAISLILLALISTDKVSSETKPTYKLIMNELSRYDSKYPLCKFKAIDSTDPQIKSDLFVELINIVNEKRLPYTFEAINSIRK